MQINRTIPAIGKHIIAKDALASGSVGIGVDESAQVGIVVTGLQIEEFYLSVVNISTIAQGVHRTEGICHGASGGQMIAYGIIYYSISTSALSRMAAMSP